jgi:hypothetical protein
MKSYFINARSICINIEMSKTDRYMTVTPVPNIVKCTDIFLKLAFDVVVVGISKHKKIILEDSTKKEDFQFSTALN